MEDHHREGDGQWGVCLTLDKKVFVRDVYIMFCKALVEGTGLQKRKNGSLMLFLIYLRRYIPYFLPHRLRGYTTVHCAMSRGFYHIKQAQLPSQGRPNWSRFFSSSARRYHYVFPRRDGHSRRLVSCGHSYCTIVFSLLSHRSFVRLAQ